MLKYFNGIKDFLIWAITMAIILFALCGLHQCDLNASKVPQNANMRKVDTILTVRHDTINSIKTELKTKTIYIDTGRIRIVHDTFNSWIKPIGPETTCIADNQLRECVKCKDSLVYSKKVNLIDSVTIDSLSKLAKTPDTIKINNTWTRLKDIGTGVLIGAGIRSFF